MITHQPFDHGALDFLSSLAGQKTIKAMCGKRVAFASARAHLPVSCPSCRASLQAEIASACKLSAEIRAGMHGPVGGLPPILDKRAADFAAILAR